MSVTDMLMILLPLHSHKKKCIV